MNAQRQDVVLGRQKRGQATFLESKGYASDWKRESLFGWEAMGLGCELIGKKSGEPKGGNFISMIVNLPITSLAGNGADGPNRMRVRVEFSEFML